MQAETRKCQNCKADFTIEPNDFGFYEKIRVPPPTFCPDCRRQRRWAWRNNVSLYNRKCDLCGKSVISIYSPDSGLVIYCNKCWWSDKWDPKSYAMDYDFSRPFFTQFRELLQKVPQIKLRIHARLVVFQELLYVFFRVVCGKCHVWFFYSRGKRNCGLQQHSLSE